MAQVFTVERPSRVPSVAVALHDVDVVPVDTDGRDLRLHTVPTPHRAVCSRVVVVGPWSVELDILAASHRVTVRGRDATSTGPPPVSETVACGDVHGAIGHDTLPNEHRWSSAGWQLRFHSEIRFGADALGVAVQQIEQLQHDDRAIVGRFPGDLQALTALAVDCAPRLEHSGCDDRLPEHGRAPDLVWRSWHLYPGPDAHAVITHTIARPPAHLVVAAPVAHERTEADV